VASHANIAERRQTSRLKTMKMKATLFDKRGRTGAGAHPPGTRIIAYGVQDRGAAAVTNAMLIYSNLTWKGFGIDRWLEQSGQMQSRAMLDQLCSMVHNGTLRLPIASCTRSTNSAMRSRPTPGAAETER